MLLSAVVALTSPDCMALEARFLDGVAGALIRVGLKSCMLHVMLLS